MSQLKLGEGNINVSNDNRVLEIYHPNNDLSSFTVSNFSGGGFWAYWQSNTNDLFILHNNNLRGRWDDITGSYFNISDRKLKTNIQPLKEVLPVVEKIKLVNYEFIDSPSNRQIGVIAQDLGNYFPELVSKPEVLGETGKSAPYMVNYSGLSVVALKAIQEQQKEINTLKNEIEMLKRMVTKLSTKK